MNLILGLLVLVFWVVLFAGAFRSSKAYEEYAMDPIFYLKPLRHKVNLWLIVTFLLSAAGAIVIAGLTKVAPPLGVIAGIVLDGFFGYKLVNYYKITK